MHHARLSAKVTLLSVLLAAVAIMAPGLDRPAHADEGTGETITLPLTVDCSSVPDTPEAREQLEKHKLCGYGQEPGEPVPMATTIGNCGTLSLNVFDSRGGNMLWKMEMNSSLGPMGSASYTGAWRNLDLSVGGDVFRTTGPNLGTWLDTFNIYTRPGRVAAKITGATLVTIYGLTCVNNGPLFEGVTVT